jgi:hypothetical protein
MRRRKEKESLAVRRREDGWRLVLGFGIKPSVIPCKII